MQNRIIYLYSLSLMLLASCHPLGTNETEGERVEKTAIQTASPWKPELDIRSDIAIIYGMKTQDYLDFGDGEATFEERVRSWRNNGYQTHFMTGISWGEYADYISGNWDGTPHYDEGQKTLKGDTCWHHDNVPYIVPTESFLDYIKLYKIKRMIDVGIDVLYLAEPEFWAFAGYSDAFKSEWEKYYGFEWRPQHLSAENLYLSNKLKHHLFYNAIDECNAFAKKYGKSRGLDVKCFVTTHSLLNYAQWQIVSPEASLGTLANVDGYVGQVWAGTARLPNYYNGELKERIFETAYLEYGLLESMASPTNRKLFFLTDPLEDWPRDWEEYLRNYEAIFAAQLFYPKVDNYIVMQWPERIYEGEYKAGKMVDRKSHVPEYFSAQMQIMVQSLSNMPASDNVISGTDGISVLTSNSIMYQCSDEPIDGYLDKELSNFFGLTMPFIKRGIPVNTIHIENLSSPKIWDNTKLLLMTYSNMKPLDEKAHYNIADWVRNGGVLVYVSKDNDPFQGITEWWNSNGNNWKHPADHLFSLMNVPECADEGTYTFGKGKICVIRSNPEDFVKSKGADLSLVNTVDSLFQEAANEHLNVKNYIDIQRGAYKIISVMDESPDSAAYETSGLYIDLFSSNLPIVEKAKVYPGDQAFLYDLSVLKNSNKAKVIASSSRIYDEIWAEDSYSFIAKGPLYTNSVLRIYSPAKAKDVWILNKKGKKQKNITIEWDETSHTYYLKFKNLQDGVKVMFIH